MRAEMANLIFPVFSYAIRLREQLQAGDMPNFTQEQKNLLGLLQTPTLEKDFSGETVVSESGRVGKAGEVRAARTDVFLGVRYALVCWLDEIFIADSPWKTEWTENKLEQTIYGSNVRHFKFWEQARRAETRFGTDALEAYYLCVMLGFRGELEGNPDKLRAWRQATESQISRGQEQEFPTPPEHRPRTFVPPLLGEKRKQTMLLCLGVALLLLIPTGIYVLLSQAAKL